MSLQRITELCLYVDVLIMNADLVHVIICIINIYVLWAYQLHGYNIMQGKWSTLDKIHPHLWISFHIVLHKSQITTKQPVTQMMKTSCVMSLFVH